MKRNLLFIIAICISLGLNAQHWTQQNTNMTGTGTGKSIAVDQVSIVDSNIVWVNGFNGSGAGKFIKAMSRTQDGGATWTAGSYNGFGTYVQATVLTGVSYNKAFCIAYDTAGGIASFWKTTDGGANWALVTGVLNTGTTTFADGVKFWSNGKGFCYGDPVSGSFNIYTTSDSGTTWTAVPGANISAPLSGEYGYNGPDCAAIVEGGIGFFMTNHNRVYKTTDYGSTWAITPTAPLQTATANASSKIAASSANYIIAASLATSTSTSYDWRYTTDGGATWDTLVPASGNLYDYGLCYVPGTSNMFVASSPNTTTVMGIAYSADGGLNWTDFVDANYLQPVGGTNIQCLGTSFYSSKIGWVGNYDNAQTINSILKYDDPIGITAVKTYTVEQNDFHICPNPSRGNVMFSINGANANDINLKVLDLTGKVIFEKVLNVKGVSTTSYDFSNLSKGMYIVNISSAKENITKKLIIN